MAHACMRAARRRGRGVHACDGAGAGDADVAILSLGARSQDDGLAERDVTARWSAPSVCTICQ